MTLAEQAIAAARAGGYKIGLAESCTGGMVAAALTAVPGSSAAFLGGIVSYSNEVKASLLGVQASTLQKFGAVSEEVAAEMARGATLRLQVDVAVAITGIAGPGGSEFKPEGRVCFGWEGVKGHGTQTVEFGALGRDAVRQAATEHALAILVRLCHAAHSDLDRMNALAKTTP